MEKTLVLHLTFYDAKVKNYKQIRSKIGTIFCRGFTPFFAPIFEAILSDILPCRFPHFFFAS